MDKMQSARIPASEELNYYFRSAFSVSCVIFGLEKGRMKVLLVKRMREPYKNMYSLPAELVYPNDSIEERADSIIEKVTGTPRFYKKQIRAFADAARHPLGRVVSIGYYSFVNIPDCTLFTSDDEHNAAEWVDMKTIPELAFDHNEIVEAAKRRLISKMSTQLTGFELLPPQFTLKQVQEMYEAVLGHELDKRNFRRKVLAQEVVKETGIHLNPWEESGKAPMLYSLDNELYQRLKSEGQRFEIF